MVKFTYRYCPACKRVQMAVVKGNEATCQKCGSKHQVKKVVRNG
jgi:DNA-directed RNA polymerase subunit RPC12/RpoP